MWEVSKTKEKLLEWLLPNKGTLSGPLYALVTFFSFVITGIFIKILFQGSSLNDPSVLGILFGLYCFIVAGVKRLRATKLSAWFLLAFLFTPINVFFYFYLIGTTRGEENSDRTIEVKAKPSELTENIKPPKQNQLPEVKKTKKETATVPKIKKEKKSTSVTKKVEVKTFKEVRISVTKTVPHSTEVKDTKEKNEQNRKKAAIKTFKEEPIPVLAIKQTEKELSTSVIKSLPRKNFKEVPIALKNPAPAPENIIENTKGKKSKSHPSFSKEVFTDTYLANKSKTSSFKVTQVNELRDISPKTEVNILDKEDLNESVNQEKQTKKAKTTKSKPRSNTTVQPQVAPAKPLISSTISAPPLWLPFNHKSICLDTETTGLTSKDRICEIAALEFNTNTFKIIDQFHVYINPCMRMPYNAWRVHGLSDDFLRDKPVFKDVASDLLAFIQNSTIYIHNAAFDKRMLNAEFARLGMNRIENYCSEIQCTYQMAVRKRGRGKNRLDDLCDCFHIDHTNRQLHGALVDCQLLVQVIQQLQKL